MRKVRCYRVVESPACGIGPARRLGGGTVRAPAVEEAVQNVAHYTDGPHPAPGGTGIGTGRARRTRESEATRSQCIGDHMQTRSASFAGVEAGGAGTNSDTGAARGSDTGDTRVSSAVHTLAGVHIDPGAAVGASMRGGKGVSPSTGARAQGHHNRGYGARAPAAHARTGDAGFAVGAGVNASVRSDAPPPPLFHR